MSIWRWRYWCQVRSLTSCSSLHTNQGDHCGRHKAHGRCKGHVTETTHFVVTTNSSFTLILWPHLGFHMPMGCWPGLVDTGMDTGGDQVTTLHRRTCDLFVCFMIHWSEVSWISMFRLEASTQCWQSIMFKESSSGLGTPNYGELKRRCLTVAMRRPYVK